MAVCRACLSAEDLNELFAKYSEKDLYLVTGLKILKNDKLSQKLCTKCERLINIALELRTQCLHAQQVLIIDIQTTEKRLAMEKCKSSIADLGNDDDDDLICEDLDVFDDNLDDVDDILRLNKKSADEEGITSDSKIDLKGLVKEIQCKKYNRVDLRTLDSNFDGADEEMGLERKSNKINQVKCSDRNRNTGGMFRRGRDNVGNCKNFSKADQKNLALDKISNKIEKICINTKKENKSDLRHLVKEMNNIIINADIDTFDDNYDDIHNETVKGNNKTSKEANKLRKTKKISDKNSDFNESRDVNDDTHDTPEDLVKIYEIIDNEFNTSLKIDEKDILKEDAVLKLLEDSKPKAVKRNIKRTPQDKKRLERLWSIADKPINKNGLVKCLKCSKEFRFKYFLQHAGTHFDAEFTCEKCGMKFMNGSSLRQHQQRRHGAPRPHACPHCQYRAVLKDELANHKNRYHTGERPFVCDVCAERFCQRRTLVQHMNKHYARKIHQCDFCSKLYATRSQLSSHRNRFHLLRYTFFCYVCTYQSSCRKTVRNHITKVHGIFKEDQKNLKFIKEKR